MPIEPPSIPGPGRRLIPSRPCLAYNVPPSLSPTSTREEVPVKRPLFLVLLLVVAIVPAALAATPRDKQQPADKKPPAEAAKKGAKEDEAPKPGFNAETLQGLALRSIGPALTSGRISDFAVDPAQRQHYFVAVSSGGVWKTTNAGTTWKPVFDGEGSFSIGCIALDPQNPSVVWVGTGENNSQRSVAYGDGVYKSVDGGESWKRMGLEKSEHVGKILVDPRDGNVVWVAAQGPLWAPGGDRGLYKTTDGGQTWKAVLTLSENTGVSDIAFDPRDPDVVYATAYQRRRHVWTLIDGGPESAIHKTTDGGVTWTKLSAGLPKEEMGRIGIAVAPSHPDWVYAVIEAADKERGFYRSTDRGATWEKRSDYVPGGPQYYNEITVDPLDPERVYAVDVYFKVTDDGGKTFHNLGESSKHVDNHAIWIDPHDTDYYLVGCDGGIYESFDRAQTWNYKSNLPVTQFYRVAVDDAVPFYNVYGGTQDNFSLGGPSRTRTLHGVTNQDWIVTWGGDGFFQAVEPQNPDIVYSEAQYGALGRYDRKSGQALGIQPQAGPGEPPLRFNWDSPFLVSPHSPTRLYFAAQKLFRSDDRGNTWRAVSGDLSRQIDRNQLPVMGKIWGPDAVAKNSSTSFYGSILSVAESPRQEDLLYAGTDDGLVQVSDNGGQTWTLHEAFPGVPDRTPVSRLAASQHDANRVYAAFDNHQMGDFKPYVLKSTDRGRTWASIAGDLPERGSVYSLAEDPVDPNLLFCGTEFGLYCTVDGGKKWVRLKGGLPTIQVRDLVIQPRENDLVVGTFGRGIYILDDYALLRGLRQETLQQSAILFPARTAPLFIQPTPLGLKGRSFQGESFYAADNPPFGAVFTYYLKEELKTRKKLRQEAEKTATKKGEPIHYPTPEELRAEDREEPPAILLIVKDATGHVVREITGPTKAGFQRVAWGLRLPPVDPVSLAEKEQDQFSLPPMGPLAVPGRYTVSLAQRVDGQLTSLAAEQPFEATAIGTTTLSEMDRTALLAFQADVAGLQRAVLGAVEAAKQTQVRIDHLKKALLDTPAADPRLGDDLRSQEARLAELRRVLEGDRALARRNEPVPPSIAERVGGIVESQWLSTSAPTATNREQLGVAGQAFKPVLEELRQISETDLRALEDQLERAGAPWTPGRVPRWPAD
jgi:photosystem II stability/assembly factor-like uncharacterized protein